MKWFGLSMDQLSFHGCRMNLLKNAKRAWIEWIIFKNMKTQYYLLNNQLSGCWHNRTPNVSRVTKFGAVTKFHDWYLFWNCLVTIFGDYWWFNNHNRLIILKIQTLVAFLNLATNLKNLIEIDNTSEVSVCNTTFPSSNIPKWISAICHIKSNSWIMRSI